MRFIRQHGKIVPINDERNVKGAAVGGAAVGAAYHVQRESAGHVIDQAAKNTRSVAKFKSELKAGDILIMGSIPKHSGGHEFGDIVGMLPKKVQGAATKYGKKIGLNKNTLLASNSSILKSVGAGNKYHAGVYLGKGRVAHMSTDHGAVSEKLHDVIRAQNVSAYRFKGADKEAEAAVKFAKKAVKAKVPYKATMGATDAAVNLVTGIGRKATKCLDPMVCHTLPLRAYSGRSAGLAGENAFSGAIKHIKGISAIARRDTIKAPLMGARVIAGSVLKGAKWGLAAGLAAAAIGALARHRRRRE